MQVIWLMLTSNVIVVLDKEYLEVFLAKDFWSLGWPNVNLN